MKKISSNINKNNMEENTINDEKLLEAKKEIEAVLSKYGIVLVPIVIHHGDKTISRIDVAPAAKNPSEVQS